jgi:hypothetical protein
MDAAVGNPNAYLQAKAGHSSFSITERYIHAAQTAFPGAVERSEERLFGSAPSAAVRGAADSRVYAGAQTSSFARSSSTRATDP